MTDEQPFSSEPKNWFKKLKSKIKYNGCKKNNLLHIVKAAKLNKEIDEEVLRIIEGALQVCDLQARDIMIPRSQIVCVSYDESPEHFLPRIMEAGHSRYPVIGESPDEIIGTLLAKDLLPLLLKKRNDYSSFNLKSLIRKPVFVPESKRLTMLLKNFRKNRNHMAVVVDEYGGVAGLVTIEDVLEEIVGDIEDEYDVEPDTLIKPMKDNQFLVNALTPIEEFNDFFHCSLCDDDFETIGGLIVQKFGYVPKRNELVVLSNFEFKVMHADSRRVRSLQVKKIMLTLTNDKQNNH